MISHCNIYSLQSVFQFFQWLDERNKGGFVGGRRKISEPHSLITHMKSQRVHFYSPCSLVSKCKENIKNHFKPVSKLH